MEKYLTTKQVMNSRNYETVFIIDAAIPAKNISGIINAVKSFITDNGGQIVECVNAGTMKLAYEIKGKGNGVYVFIEFKSSVQFIKNLEILYHRESNILRSIVCSLDKYGVEYNSARRAKKEKIFNNQKVLSLI